MDEIAIKVDNVGKTFRLPHEKNNSIKSAVVNFSRHKRSFEEQQVLENASFEIKKGEFFGIVGRNGSGKSTLLKMLAGIYSPTEGSIKINGKLTPFIELGVGFSPELTGRENIFLNGALLGFSRKEMETMYKGIVKFAELERFMDQKLKNYSSGMQVRLAFSIAIRAKSDILLIDEVLAVGDAAFQSKCFDYFSELKKKETTVVFVSHDRGSLERFCERGILLDNGKIIESGNIRKVLSTYSGVVLGELENAASISYDETEEPIKETEKTPKSRYAAIDNVLSATQEGHAKTKFNYGEKISVSFDVLVKAPIVNPIVGVTVWQKNVERPIFATNTLIEGNKATGMFNTGDRLHFKTSLPDLMNDGEFYIEPAIANESATVFYDQKPAAATFYISGSNNPYSLFSATDKAIFEIKRAH